jgi:threonine/homoserine/homoserine lactone efflux protein
VIRDFAAFLGVAVLVIVTPGQDTALTVRNVLLGGRRSGVGTAIGVASGNAIWTLAASAGLTALLLASEPAFVALRLVGAEYLVYLGGHALLAALRPGHAHPLGVRARRGGRLPPRRAYRQGLISNLGNPKMAVFFASLLPQFVPKGGGSFLALLGLGLLFSVLTLSWLVGYAFAVARAGHVLERPRVRRLMDAVTGTVLVAFGLRLAAERR